jgi:hypothetical protein
MFFFVSVLCYADSQTRLEKKILRIVFQKKYAFFWSEFKFIISTTIFIYDNAMLPLIITKTIITKERTRKGIKNKILQSKERRRKKIPNILPIFSFD